MFQLTQKEMEYLRSKILTANISSKSRSRPYVFTEQGVYMLMTVLKGELAVSQSKMLLRLFNQMKDYVVEKQQIINQRDFLRLSLQTAENAQNYFEVRQKLEISRLTRFAATVGPLHGASLCGACVR